MNLRLGNLTVEQFGELVGADLTAEEIAMLETYRTDRADFTDPAKFHIFEHPAVSVVIGQVAFAEAAPVFIAANDRKPFNREVGFYPTTKED